MHSEFKKKTQKEILCGEPVKNYIRFSGGVLLLYKLGAPKLNILCQEDQLIIPNLF